MSSVELLISLLKDCFMCIDTPRIVLHILKYTCGLSHFQESEKPLYPGLFWLQPCAVLRISAFVNRFITRLIQPTCHYALRCQVI